MKKSTTGTKYSGKKILFTLFMMLALLISSLPLTDEVQAATPDIIITSFTATNEPLTKNEEFALTDFTYENVSGVELTNVSIDFSDSSNTISMAEGVTTIIPTDRTMPADDFEIIDSIDLRFIGDGTNSRIPIIFNYTKAGSATETTAIIVLRVAQPSAPPSSDQKKKKTYIPKLTAAITGNNYTEGGKQNELKILIKNTSPSFAAKNIAIDLPEENGSPFTSLQFGTQLPVVTLNPNTSIELSMTVATDIYSPAGAYKLPLHVTFENAWGNSFASDYTLPVTVGNANTKGTLLVEVGAPTPAITAGSTFTLPVTIKNTGSLPVYDAKVFIEFLSTDSFSLAEGGNRILFDRIDGGTSKKITLKLNTAATIKAGSAPVIFNLEYKDARNVSSTDSQQQWLPVTDAGAADKTLEITQVTTSRTTMKPGDKVVLTVVIKNTGTSEAQQVKVSGEVGSELFFPISQNIFIVKTLKPEEEKKLTFSYQAQSDAKRGSVPLTVKIDPPANSGETGIPLMQAVSVFIEGETAPEDASKNIPKIIVYSYSAEPGLVTAGGEFDLKLSFMNTHAGKSIYNIKANFTVNEASSESGSVFTPVGSSNTFYIDQISPKNTIEKTIRLYTIPDAKSKTYNVTISFDYEDETGNPYKTDEMIGIPVYQPTRFEITEPNYQTDTMVGQMMPVSFEMVNLGKNLLYNVKMRVVSDPEGMVELTPKSQYYGNFDPGHNEYAEVMLNPMMAGSVKGTIVVTYESASGEIEEATKDFSVNIADMPPIEEFPGEVIGPDGKPIPVGPDGMPIIDESQEKGFIGKIWSSIWGKLGAGILLIGVVIFVIRRFRKKKEEKGLEF